tara:strand:+ start:338 stop:796 length:459 start_codon:yes stop_codon:yes gene_type:complete
MITRKRKRLNLILIGCLLLTAAAFLVGYGMKDGIEFFKSPTQVLLEPTLVGKQFRLGGLVQESSIKKYSDGTISFVIHDNLNFITVKYQGILPSLFEENQGVIVRGTIGENKVFVANEVLAKHDENYLPKEIVDTLKSQGLFVQPNRTNLMN